MASQGYTAAHKAAFNAAIRHATVDDAYTLWQQLQAASTTPPRQVIIQLLGLAAAGAQAGLSKVEPASATEALPSTSSAPDKDAVVPGKYSAGAIAATAPSKPHGVALPPSAAFAAAMRGPAGGPTHTRPAASCSLSSATLAAWATDMMQRAAEPRAADKQPPPAMPEAAWTTYIRVLACAQQVDTARAAVQAMLDQGVAPKLRTFAGLLEHAAEHGDVPLLAEIWAHMYSAQLQPGASEFAHALQTCVQAASRSATPAAAVAAAEHTDDNLFALGQLLLHRALATVLHAPDALQSAVTVFFQAAPALAATPAPVSLHDAAWRVQSQVVGMPTEAAPSTGTEVLAALSAIHAHAPEPWQVRTVRIPADGQVPGSSHLRVRGIDLAAPDVAALAAQVRHLAVSGISKRFPQGDTGNAARRAAQMQAFDHMLDKVEPFDVIIDAANVAHFAAAGQMSLHQLHACVCDLILSGRRVLVVLHDSWLRESGKAGPGHKRARPEDSSSSAWSSLPASMYDWAPEHFGHAWSHGWQAGAGGAVLESHASGLAPAASAQNCMLWRVHRGNNDDWYWLYAALRQQRDRPEHPVHVLSNDQMRDHHFAMLAPAALLQWRARHQVTYDVRAPAHTGATGWTWFWHWPPAVSHRAQADPSGSAWYFPISSDLELLHAAVSQQGGQREVANPAAAPPPSEKALESEWLVAHERSG